MHRRLNHSNSAMVIVTSLSTKLCETVFLRQEWLPSR